MKFSLVSICIPTYNGEAYIAEAMDSALAQTYPNLEIVVSDDASTDSTLQIIETYRDNTSIPIHIYHHKPNGIGANWNYCIQQAKGIYIKFLFQDDVLLPHCVATMVGVLEQHPSFGLVACKRELIVEPTFLNATTKKWIEIYGDLQSTLHLPTQDGLFIIDKRLFKLDAFFNSPLNKIGEPTTILFRRALVNKIGYFREDLKQVLDYEFCYRVLKRNKIAIIDEQLVKFRLHPMQTTILNKGNEQKDYEVYDQIIYKNYFWYLNAKTKRYFLNKYSPIARLVFRTIKKLSL